MLHDHINQSIEASPAQARSSSVLKRVPRSGNKWSVMVTGCLLLIIVATVLFSTQVTENAEAARTKSSNLYVTSTHLPTPIVDASPLYLQFSTLQGNTAVLHQVITIKSRVHKKLYWRFSFTTNAKNWFAIAPTSGELISGQSTAAITVSVVSTKLLPGRYTAQVALIITDSHTKIIAGGSLTSIITLLVTRHR